MSHFLRGFLLVTPLGKIFVSPFEEIFSILKEEIFPSPHCTLQQKSHHPFFEEEIFSGSEEIFSPLQHFAKFPGLSIMSQKAIGKTRILISLLSNYSISGINWYQHSAVIWEMFEKKYFPSAISSF